MTLVGSMLAIDGASTAICGYTVLVAAQALKSDHGPYPGPVRTTNIPLGIGYIIVVSHCIIKTYGRYAQLP